MIAIIASTIGEGRIFVKLNTTFEESEFVVVTPETYHKLMDYEITNAIFVDNKSHIASGMSKAFDFAKSRIRKG